MEIKLEKLQPGDSKFLYEFEIENRDYIEKMVPGRGEDYYSFNTFNLRHENPFKQVSTSNEEFMMNGNRLKFVCYERANCSTKAF
ncbi:hypothetical protein [Jeotgalibacillus campisalis]|uniref:hypothetical protein n=1 Tax=Jeotgalibacillus campisalis TaxID=220754 RepID=UPI0006984C06|nr:hypothetical protein [Jeotgalibacillus campisalis]